MLIDEAAKLSHCFLRILNAVSPFDISLVPNNKKRTTTRGSKAAKLQSHHWITTEESVYHVSYQKFFQEDVPEFSGVRDWPGVRGRKTNCFKKNSAQEKIQFIFEAVKLL